MIFAEFERVDSTPKLSRESEYHFTNRSARPEIARVRALLEALAHDYPQAEQSELVARFQSGDDAAYRSAEFELLLHGVLRATNCTLEPHPALQNGIPARPDFLVTTADGSRFYLEAVSPSEVNMDISGSALTAQTLDVLSTSTHANFIVSVETKGHPNTQPSGTKFLRSVLRWLDTLDPDAVEVETGAQGQKAQPCMAWRHEELEIKVGAIPLRPERRGKAPRLLGVRLGGAGWVSPKTVVREAVRRKGTKYGHLDHPLVIAVSLDGFGLDRMDETDALFGDQVMVFQIDNPDDEGRLKRTNNGAWAGPNGPEFTRVAGAWLFDRLSPYVLTERTGTLYLNPFAPTGLPPALRRFAHAYGENGRLHWVDGPTVAELLNIPKTWLDS